MGTEADRLAKDCARKLRQYDARMAEARRYLGSVCVVCGTDRRLQFDHIDPLTKVAEISVLWSHSREVFFDEVEKCQLLCSENHLEKTLGERQMNFLERLRAKQKRDAEDPVPF